MRQRLPSETVAVPEWERTKKKEPAFESFSGMLTIFMFGTMVAGLYFRYQWAFSTLPPMSGVAHRDEFGKSGLSKLRWEMADHERSLADKEVERSGTERPIGNPDCFDDEDYTYDRCCDLTIGPVGDKACWRGDGGFGYGDCCNGVDSRRVARALMLTGERYLRTAQWLWFSSDRERHLVDAIAIYKMALKYEPGSTELGWRAQDAERFLHRHRAGPETPPPPPPPRPPPPGGQPAKDVPELPKRPAHEVLQVGKSAGQDEIRSAYKKLSRKLHPDRHRGDLMMSAKFMEVAQAYEELTAAAWGDE